MTRNAETRKMPNQTQLKPLTRRSKSPTDAVPPMTHPDGRFDIQAVLDRLPAISTFFERDGHTPKRSGAALFCCCPFHEERTPSCQILDDHGKFHCYGCGAHGDIFDYWQKTKGSSFADSLATLAALAGVSPNEWQAPTDKPITRTSPVAKPLAPLDSATLTIWQAATARLISSHPEINRIAAWRGIDPAVVRWAAESNLMGLFPYRDGMREAFLVEAPDPTGRRIPVSVHCRLAPDSKGNPGPKASWRYVPAGVGSWPFIVGDLSTAFHIFCMEGQWDALALVSCMGWHQAWPPTVAVCGLRGATSHAKLLACPINPEAYVFAFADADTAGNQWFEAGGFLDRFGARLSTPHHLHGFRADEDGMDFNDLVKLGRLDRDTLIALIAAKLPTRRTPPPGPTFAAWCRSHRTSQDPELARAAAFVCADKQRPASRAPLELWIRHWQHLALSDDLRHALATTWDTYQSDCRNTASACPHLSFQKS
jgi:hypothetical protein